jgi:hypothetical protein
VPDLTQIVQVDIPVAQLVEFVEGLIGREEFKSPAVLEWTPSLASLPKSIAERLEDYFVRFFDRGIGAFLTGCGKTSIPDRDSIYR